MLPPGEALSSFEVRRPVANTGRSDVITRRNGGEPLLPRHPPPPPQSPPMLARATSDRTGDRSAESFASSSMLPRMVSNLDGSRLLNQVETLQALDPPAFSWHAGVRVAVDVLVRRAPPSASSDSLAGARDEKVTNWRRNAQFVPRPTDFTKRAIWRDDLEDLIDDKASFLMAGPAGASTGIISAQVATITWEVQRVEWNNDELTPVVTVETSTDHHFYKFDRVNFKSMIAQNDNIDDKFDGYLQCQCSGACTCRSRFEVKQVIDPKRFQIHGADMPDGGVVALQLPEGGCFVQTPLNMHKLAPEVIVPATTTTERVVQLRNEDDRRMLIKALDTSSDNCLTLRCEGGLVRLSNGQELTPGLTIHGRLQVDGHIRREYWARRAARQELWKTDAEKHGKADLLQDERTLPFMLAATDEVWAEKESFLQKTQLETMEIREHDVIEYDIEGVRHVATVIGQHSPSAPESMDELYEINFRCPQLGSHACPQTGSHGSEGEGQREYVYLRPEEGIITMPSGDSPVTARYTYLHRKMQPLLVLRIGVSYAEVVSDGMPIDEFISHSWTEASKDLLVTLRRAHVGRIWVCTAAVCQHLIELSDWEVSPFYIALTSLNERRGRVVMALDDEASALTRIWCIFEVWVAGTFRLEFQMYTRHGEVSLWGSDEDTVSVMDNLRNLDVRAAKSTVQADYDMILKKLEENNDLESVEWQIKRALSMNSVVAAACVLTQGSSFMFSFPFIFGYSKEWLTYVFDQRDAPTQTLVGCLLVTVGVIWQIMKFCSVRHLTRPNCQSFWMAMGKADKYDRWLIRVWFFEFLTVIAVIICVTIDCMDPDLPSWSDYVEVQRQKSIPVLVSMTLYLLFMLTPWVLYGLNDMLCTCSSWVPRFATHMMDFRPACPCVGYVIAANGFCAGAFASRFPDWWANLNPLEVDLSVLITIGIGAWVWSGTWELCTAIACEKYRLRVACVLFATGACLMYLVVQPWRWKTDTNEYRPELLFSMILWVSCSIIWNRYYVFRAFCRYRRRTRRPGNDSEMNSIGRRNSRRERGSP